MAERAGSGRAASRTNSTTVAAELCASGWGVAVLPTWAGDARRDLARVWREVVARVDLWIVVHPDLARTARVRALMDHVEAAAGRVCPCVR